jgi:flagellar motor switch/type III secretory pathway protein FliN
MAAATVNPQVQPVPEPDVLWAAALYLACDLRVELQAPGFTVRDLLQLAPGSLVATNVKHGSNVPLTVNGLALAWTAFETLGEQLAIRIMEFV